MIARVFLGLMAVLFIYYGLACLIDPGLLSEGAGVMATTPTGTIELQAMYGGLQTAVGVLCALGAWSKAYERVALVALLFIFAGLGVVRISLGLIQGVYSDYNVFAMSLEAFCLGFLLWHLLWRKDGA